MKLRSSSGSKPSWSNARACTPQGGHVAALLSEEAIFEVNLWDALVQTKSTGKGRGAGQLRAEPAAAREAAGWVAEVV